MTTQDAVWGTLPTETANERVAAPALSPVTITVVAGLILGTAFGGGAAIAAALGALCLWAITGPQRIIQAIVLAVIITSANPELGLAEGPAILMRWLLLGVCLGAVFLTLLLTRRQLRLCGYHVVAVLYLIVMSFFTALTSYNVPISLMKLISYCLVTGTIAVAFAILWEEELEALRRWFDNFWYGFILATLFFAVTPYGYLLNGDLQGSIYNPQPFSVICVFGFVWFAYRYVTSPDQRRLILAALAALLAFIAASASRTALLALVVSVLIPAAIFLTIRVRALDGAVRLLLSPGALAIYVVTMVVLMFSTIDLGQMVHDMVRKYEDTTSFVEAFQAARGRVIYQSWVNFLEHPVFGIGFGIPSSLDVTNITVDPIFGLPISSSVEKGNIYSAVLEETGFIGTAFFVMIIITLFTAPGVVAASIPILIAGLAVNLGEAIFFSMGGVGLLLWVMVGFAGSFTAAPSVRTDPTPDAY